MYELLPMTPMNGRSKRTIVSKSQPVRLKAPSPNRHSTSLSRRACLAAIAKAMPTPSVPSGPGRRGEDEAGVADDPQVDVPIFPDSAVVEVDLDDLGGRRQALAVAHPE